MKPFILVNSLSRRITYFARAKPFQQHTLPINALPTPFIPPPKVVGSFRQFTSNPINNQKRSVTSRSSSSSPKMSEQEQNSHFQGTTVAELEHWLQNRGINTSLYGVGASKSLELLLEEVAAGETILTGTTSGTSSSGAQRTVSVVTVRVRNSEGHSLYEATQILPTGVERPRNLPLSEKMLPSEKWQEAATRGIDEELGTILAPQAKIVIDESTYVKTEEVKESHSYPGLQTNVRKNLLFYN